MQEKEFVKKKMNIKKGMDIKMNEKWFITGDMHGDLEFKQINEAKKLGATHLVMVGDFGYVWDGKEKDKSQLDFISKTGIEILWIDGNHENYDALKEYPEEKRYGGNVHKIRDNIFHLCRGNVYKLNGKKVFVMGGAHSRDCWKEGKYWWPDEKINDKDKFIALTNLKNYKYEVDIVLTHSGSTEMVKGLDKDFPIDDITEYLSYLEEKLKYDWWYFGHMHTNKKIPGMNAECIFKDVKPFGEKRLEEN